MSHAEKTERPWLDYALAFTFTGLFVFVRVWSSWWHNRWVGFSFGFALAVVSLARGWGRVKHDLQTKRVYLGFAIACFVMGTISIVSFLRGANGGEALFGFIMLTFGIQYAYMYRYVSEQDRLNPAAKN